MRRPRGDDEFEFWNPVTGSSNVTPLGEPESTWAGRLYVPDPTERKGWGLYHVYRASSQHKPLGFRKR